MDFQKLEISTSGRIRRPNMRQHAKFREDRSYRSGDMADFRFFFKMAAVRHLGFVMRVWEPPTKVIWWSLSLCKIWLESGRDGRDVRNASPRKIW